MKSRSSLLLAMAGMYVIAIAAESAAPAPDPAVMRAELAAYQQLPDTTGSGRYPAVKEATDSLPDHVIYRPADLSKLGKDRLGVLAFGNGGCSADGASARFHLSEIASHGYLAIASGRILSGPGAPAAAMPAPPAPPQPGVPRTLPAPATNAEQLREAIDWALAENARPDSAYYGRINPEWIAVSGWSCGGLQALQIAADPRVATTVIHNSGIWGSATLPDGGRLPKSMDIGKDVLKKLHSPVIYILGGPTDIAYANGMDDFTKIEGVPAMVANLDVGHGGTFTQPNGGLVASLAVKWLDWQLKGDARAAKYFTGNGCGICKDPAWQVESKRL
ncbi:hypothetical protein [Povalibacter sp.]|uniref:hypothetical protein n=1 Tax=Povalibacter sp. TaxID=1962978 RepID=UPI002F3E8B70